MEVLLLRAQLRGRGQLAPVDPARVLFWSNYSAKCIAQIRARHADRYGIVEFGAGKQGCGDRRIVASSASTTAWACHPWRVDWIVTR